MEKLPEAQKLEHKVLQAFIHQVLLKVHKDLFTTSSHIHHHKQKRPGTVGDIYNEQA